MCAVETRTFHRRVRDPTPSSTNHLELLQPRLFPSQSSYRIVREHPGSHSFVLGALQRVSLDHNPSPASASTTCSANTTTSPSRDRSAAAHPSTTTSRVSSDISSDPTPSGSRINLRRVYCTSSRSTTCGPACLQRHTTGMSAARI